MYKDFYIAYSYYYDKFAEEIKATDLKPNTEICGSLYVDISVDEFGSEDYGDAYVQWAEFDGTFKHIALAKKIANAFFDELYDLFDYRTEDSIYLEPKDEEK